MERPSHDHWDLIILQTVLDLILSRYQTLEVRLLKTPSTRKTIEKGGDGTDAEPMDTRGPKVSDE